MTFTLSPSLVLVGKKIKSKLGGPVRMALGPRCVVVGKLS